MKHETHLYTIDVDVKQLYNNKEFIETNCKYYIVKYIDHVMNFGSVDEINAEYMFFDWNDAHNLISEAYHVYNIKLHFDDKSKLVEMKLRL